MMVHDVKGDPDQLEAETLKLAWSHSSSCADAEGWGIMAVANCRHEKMGGTSPARSLCSGFFDHIA